MNTEKFLILKNPAASPFAAVPCLSMDDFRAELIACNGTAAAFFEHAGKLVAILNSNTDDKIFVTSTAVPESRRYPALTPDRPMFHWFERELHEQTGIVPEGHPWLKPIRFTAEEAKPGVTDYFTMQGCAAHEVAVGPVHAGVIEPGHFRFQCMGEDVYSLEISLGYQHRGIEKMLTGGPDNRTLPVVEAIAGDSSTTYAGTYCRLLEALDGDCRISDRSEAIRAIAWELERIANHIGDLGALAGDVAYLPTASYCGRIRGDVLNTTAMICGNRFGRGLITPEGVGYALDDVRAAEMLKKLKQTEKDLNNALDLLFDSPSVLDRFENTGTVSRKTAADLGLVGMAARACGISCDTRSTHPYGWYKKSAPAIVTFPDGDVAARAAVRRGELAESYQFIYHLLENLPPESESVTPQKRMADAIAISLGEGWRGMICMAAVTDNAGNFARFKSVDPSFHNWQGLAMALRGEQISNFPICNKSFNLSYCGHDL